MNQLCWRLVQFLCNGLTAEEREVVLGDLMESGESASAALLEVFNLLVRKQVALWQDWRPWLALIGVGGVTGFALSEFLSQLLLSVWLEVRTYSRYGVHYEHGVTFGQDLTYMSCLLVTFLLWFWIGCFVLGTLSGRATWITGTVFWFVTADCSWLHLFFSGNIILQPSQWLLAVVLGRPLLSPAVLFLPLGIWGMRQGARQREWQVKSAFTAVVAVTILTVLLVWMMGWYEAGMQAMSAQPIFWPPWYARLPLLLLVSWPVCYLLTPAVSKERKTNL